MIWVAIAVLFFFAVCGLLFAPLELIIDSRVPVIILRWVLIGKAMISFEKDDWLIDLRILFYRRKWKLEELILAKRKRKKEKARKGKEKMQKKNLHRFIRVLKSFRLTKWHLSFDSGDYTKNAWLYPLNFVPGMRHHLCINFMDENYLSATLKNSIWRIMCTWIK